MNTPIIHEVGLRDGLQIEKKVVPIEQKIKWASDLIASDIPIIQLGSFVHPEKVPQMADTDKLFSHFNQTGKKPDNTLLSGLVLNEKGLERGLACGVDMFCMGVSASNTHSQKNTGMTTQEALQRIVPMAKLALKENKKVQVSVQSAFGCGFEGKIDKAVVLDIIKHYLDAGLISISLADTASFAYPDQVKDLFESINKLSSNLICACHFHDTFGQGIANCYEAFKAGVQYFESAFGGLGGCPFTETTSGNVCTEYLVNLFNHHNLLKEIDLQKLNSATKELSLFLGRELK